MFGDYAERFEMLTREFDQVFIVIDALDGCRKGPRTLVLSFISDILRNLPCVKFFVTSRQEVAIAIFYEELYVPAIHTQAKNVQKDVDAYVSGRVDYLMQPAQNCAMPRTQRLRIQDPTMKDKIFRALVQYADGMFLWVDLQLDNVCRQKNDEDIAQQTPSLPEGLNELNCSIVAQIKEQPESLQVLA